MTRSFSMAQRIIGAVLLVLAVISLLWVIRFDRSDVRVGIDFSPMQVRAEGLHPTATFQALLSDIKPDFVRLPLVWSDSEPAQGEYTYQEITALVQAAREREVDVVVVLGRRVPGGSACTAPAWLTSASAVEREIALRNFITVSVSHLKVHKNIIAWQVEDRAFDADPCKFQGDGLLEREIALVHARDVRPVIIGAGDRVTAWSQATNMNASSTVSFFSRAIPPAVYALQLNRSGLTHDSIFAIEISSMNSPGDLIARTSVARGAGAPRIILQGAARWYREASEGNYEWISAVANMVASL